MTQMPELHKCIPSVGGLTQGAAEAHTLSDFELHRLVGEAANLQAFAKENPTVYSDEDQALIGGLFDIVQLSQSMRTEVQLARFKK